MYMAALSGISAAVYTQETVSQDTFPLKPPGTARTSNVTHRAFRHDSISEKTEPQAHVLRKRAAAAHRSGAKG